MIRTNDCLWFYGIQNIVFTILYIVNTVYNTECNVNSKQNILNNVRYSIVDG